MIIDSVRVVVLQAAEMGEPCDVLDGKGTKNESCDVVYRGFTLRERGVPYM